MVTATIITLSVLLSIALYVSYNLLNKTEAQEELLVNRDEYLAALHIKLSSSIDVILELDEKGVFRSEDEVGAFFDVLFETAKSIEQVIGGADNQN